jgi:hypothetical protein
MATDVTNNLAAALATFGLDATDLDMLTSGDMLGSRTGAKFAAALSASQAEVERLKALVEQAFRDGLTYATNVTVVDQDEAWRTSRIRSRP